MQSSHSPHSFRIQALGLVGWLLVTFAAAVIGAIASVDAASFYAQLTKPSWSPPASIFGPVWSILYILMGISVWLVWREPQGTKQVLGLFIVQLCVNALWRGFFSSGTWVHGRLLVFYCFCCSLLQLFSFWKIS